MNDPAGVRAHRGSSREPGWVADTVWWQVYPLGFTGADPRGTDRRRARGLGHIMAWLDYAADLGASGLALGPIFASSTHGYDTIDHYRVDARLGDDSDFDQLVAAAHDRGLRILLDGVFNHVGREWAVRRLDSDASGTDWFRRSRRQDDRGGIDTDFATFEGHQSLVVLNHDNPAVANYVVDVMGHWLNRGADGWRLDAAYAVPPPFWSEIAARVRTAHPDVYLVGEVIHGDYGEIVERTGLDSVTQYELWKATWSSLNDRNFYELAWALNRHNTYLERFVPMTFVGNHDVTRLASRLVDERHLAHALVILLTTGGTPSIYYGDEQAFRGVKEARAGGDDTIRPAYPDGPAALAPYGWPTYRLHQQLIDLRRRRPWLHAAQTRIVELTNEQLVYATTAAGCKLVVALNLGDGGARHQTDGDARLITSGPDVHLDRGHLALPAHGWAITTSDQCG